MWKLALVSTSGCISIDRRSYMQSDVGKALFLTSNKAVEHGLIGDDKDFFREGLREVEGY